MKETAERTEASGCPRIDHPRLVHVLQVEPGHMLALGGQTLLVRRVHRGEEWTAIELILLISSQGIVELRCDPFAGSVAEADS